MSDHWVRRLVRAGAGLLGAALVAGLSFLPALPAWAATVSYGSLSPSGSGTYSTSTVFTLTGTNLPILSDTGAAAGVGGGYDFPNFLLQEGSSDIASSSKGGTTSGLQWGNTGGGGVNAGAKTWGITVLSSTSSKLEFSIAYSSYSLVGPWEVWLLPSGQTVQAGSTADAGYGIAPGVSMSASVSVQAQAATVTAQGGTAPYTVTVAGSSKSIASSGGSVTFSGLAPGSYTADVTDSAGNTGTTSFTIYAPLKVSTSVSGTSMTATVTGGLAPYSLSTDGQTGTISDDGGSATFTGLPAGHQGTVTATDAEANPQTGSAPYAIGTPPPAPTGLYFQSGYGGSITLHWNAAPGATSYTVYRGDPTELGTTSRTSYTVTGASNGSVYSVTASNAVGTSSAAAITVTYIPPPVTASARMIPGFLGFGLWSGVGAILGDVWPLIILALILILSFFFMDKIRELVKGGSV